MSRYDFNIVVFLLVLAVLFLSVDSYMLWTMFQTYQHVMHLLPGH